MTPEQMTERSSKLLEQFDGLETGSVITILATALQMAVCYGAKTKEDAMHMIRASWWTPSMTCRASTIWCRACARWSAR